MFINRILHVPFKMRYDFINAGESNIYKDQENILFDILLEESLSLYGRKYGYSSIQNIESFQNSVPLADYESIQELILAMVKGKENILTVNHTPWFTKSAGSTATYSKYLPVTYEALKENHFKCSKDFLTTYIYENQDTKLFEGKGIVLAGGFEDNPYTGEKNIGYISSILSSEKPRWGGYFTALGDEFLQIPTREEKMEYIYSNFKDEVITSISGVGPWIIQLARYIEKKAGRSITDVWPHLELILSGGVNIDLYKDQYYSIFGDSIKIYNMYNASEGFFGFQINPHDSDVYLATSHSIFYEFIPMDSFEGIHSKKVYTLQDIIVDVDYAIVITTKAGLYRYILGDTVKFTSLDPFKIKITGRTKFYINQRGEQLYGSHIHRALAETCKLLNAVVHEYIVGPLQHSETHGRHEWMIEFEKRPNDIDEFTQMLDQQLQIEAYHYATKRKDNALLLAPKITLVNSGSFVNRMKSRGKLGGQNKVPNVWTDRTYLDNFYEFLSYYNL